MALRVLIVDDEPLTRRALQRQLALHVDVEVIGECGDGASAVTAIRAHRPDLVFLDVAMPELSGIEVVDRVGAEAMPATIFVTAYDQYAVQAFDADAVDYLLKPFTKQRFARALSRARERIAGKLNGGGAHRVLTAATRVEGADHAPHLAVDVGGSRVVVSVDDVVWLRADGNYVRIRAGDHTYSLRETLAGLQGRLDPRQFVRIHRSTIVNVRRVRQIRPWVRGHHVVILDTGERLRMSRYQRDAAVRLGL